MGEEVSKKEEERMRKEEEEQERVLLEGVERVQTRQFGVRLRLALFCFSRLSYGRS
jgi:hypothetical protein